MDCKLIIYLYNIANYYLKILTIIENNDRNNMHTLSRKGNHKRMFSWSYYYSI